MRKFAAAALWVASTVFLFGEEKSPDHFGELQVERMLKDRPAMASFTSSEGTAKSLTAADPLWQWAAKAYAQKVNGCAIRWDASFSDKPAEYLAEHVIADQGGAALIRIRDRIASGAESHTAGFDEMWAACVFEMFNITRDSQFLDLTAKACNLEIDRAGFIRGSKMLEHSALLELKKFYREIWLPWAAANHYVTVSRYWTVDVPNDYDEWIALYRGSGIYQYWEGFYDGQIIPYLKAAGKTPPP